MMSDRLDERTFAVTAKPTNTRGILRRPWLWGQANKPGTNELLAHYELSIQVDDGHHLYLTLWNSDWGVVIAKEAINVAPMLQEWLTAILDELDTSTPSSTEKEGLEVP